MSTLPHSPMRRRATPSVATAQAINSAHRAARESAHSAVERAIECGRLLLDVKAELAHGQFEAWIERHCEFAVSTARRYVIAAKRNATAVAFSSLRELFPSGQRPARDPATPALAAPPEPRGAPEPAALPPAVAAEPEAAQSVDDPPGDFVPWTAADEAEEQARIARELDEAIARFIDEDDQHAAALAEIKRQAAEIAVLRITAGGFQNAKGELTRLLVAEQRKVASLGRKLDALKAENQKLLAENATLRQACEALDAEIEQLRAKLSGGGA